MKPSFKPQCLRQIASETQNIDSAPQFADHLDWQKKLVFAPIKETYNARIGPWPFPTLADHICIDKKH
jgi:hypothetical protein